MKILIALNYYYPYISGVSEVARIVAENWVKEGHKVMVVTSNHDNFPKQEVINGVTVLRTPVILKISKGVISPQFITQVIKLSKEYDVVNLHLPMIESGIIAPWIEKDKILVTYHCDVNLPNNWLNYIIVNMMDFSNRICMERAKKITVTTLDYAEHSRVANDFMDKLMETAAPPKDFKRKDESLEEKQKKIIGFCGRIVQEKGIDVLLKAYSILKQEELDVCLKIGGDYKKIAGGSVYESLRKYIQENKIEDVEFLGMIPNDKMEKFYSSLDVFVLPSINSLEAFGIVQIEAMLCGTPVVASDLPGVRTIIPRTGMGEIFEKGNANDLAEKIKMVLATPSKYIKSREEINALYGEKKVVSNYTQALMEMVKEK